MTTGFDVLLEDIEGNGWFQKRLNYFLLGPLFFVVPFAFLHQIFVLHQPDHWCTPPDYLNHTSLDMTLDDWKKMFLPQELGPDYQMRPSQCKMYDVKQQDLEAFMKRNVSEAWPEIKCAELNKWTYDQSEFIDTAATDNDWVCDLVQRPTDLFTFGNVGLILGTAVFSYLADAKGRRLAFYVSTLAMIIFQFCQIAVSHVYSAYLALKILAFACMLPLFQTPMAITTEISSIKGRALVIGMACVAWALGNMALPLIGWLIQRWKWISVVSTLPMVFVFFTWKIVPESPRWLVSVGRLEDAKRVMTEIAKVNKATVPKDLEEKLKSIIEENSAQKAYGYFSLFKTWRMSLRTICVTIAFTASAFVYYQLVINIGNLAGNTYLNMFLMGLVEGPGSMAAVFLSDKFGRRWSHFGMLATNAVLFFVLCWVVYDPDLSPLVIFFCMWIKFNISGTFVVAYVQAMELFPTNVRQSGIGFATLISQTISIGGPYVIFLAQYDMKYPYLVMFAVCAIGAIAVALLPETLGAKLPETLEEASVFGANDKFFSYLPKREEDVEANSQDQHEKQSLKNNEGNLGVE